jgi:hypothetical protein
MRLGAPVFLNYTRVDTPMTNETNTDGGKDPAAEAESPEFEEMLAGYEAAEKRRRTRGIIYGVVALLVTVGTFALVFHFKSEFFRPKMDIEEGEQQIIEQTDDPQCRDTIAQVQSLGERYFKFESTIEDDLLGDDAQAHREIRDEIARLQQRVDEIAEDSQEANLRFEGSREQLDEWFAYIDQELTFLDELAAEHLAKLKPAGEDAKKEDEQPDSDEDEGVEGVVVEEGEQAEQAEDEPDQPTSDKTPEERKQGAMVAIHDAFQKFRVWHSSSLHPCGPADEGEEPWRPDEDGEAEGDQG